MSYYRFFKVNTPFKAYRITGSVPTNSYYGRARIHQPSVREFEVKQGDIIGFGGGEDFRIVDGNNAIKFMMNPPKEPFEKSYGPGSSFMVDQRVKNGKFTPVDEPPNLRFKTENNTSRKARASRLVEKLLSARG